MDNSSRSKKLIFSTILVLGLLLVTELFASAALLMNIRLSNGAGFLKYEPTYSSAINFAYKVGIKAGIFADPYQQRISWEPEKHFVPDGELGYRAIPGEYRVTYSTTVARNRWQYLPVKQTINADGTRWTGPVGKDYKSTLYVFGDSFVYGEGIHDEHTFSALIQQARPDLRVRLFALPGWATIQAYINFKNIKSEIRPEDTIVMGYADFFDVRNVVAPSRLREMDEYFKRLARPPEEVLLPKATLNGDGNIEISMVQQACPLNKRYCEQNDPPKAEMARVTAALANYIARNTEARVIFLHFDGLIDDPNNPVLKLLDPKIEYVSVLQNSFGYFIRDNIAGFDSHPGPYWHHAVSRKLLEVLPKKLD